jgi:diacylglycerol kinase family enzyme
MYLSGVNCRECDRIRFHGPSTLEFSTSDRPEKLSVNFHDIMSVRYMERSVVIQAMVFPNQWDISPGACGCVFCHPSKPKDRMYVSISICCQEQQILDEFANVLNQEVFEETPVASPTIVFINPVSGRGQAGQDWDKTIEPLLVQSGKFNLSTILFTERRNHASEFVRDLFTASLPTSRELIYIIAVGGDGLVFEIYNGISDAAKARALGGTNYMAQLESILDRIIVCPLPCGSGNGLCFSTLGNEPFTINCALGQLIRKKTKRRDLGLVCYNDEFSGERMDKIFSLTISWGLVADVDILSEPLRFIGDSRFTLYGLVRVLRKSVYEGILKLDNETTIAPDFVTVYASIVPVAGGTVVLSPSKPMDSGKISVFTFLAKDTSRLDLLDALTELSKRREHENLKSADATSIELIPAQHDRLRGAGIVVDGEPLTRAPITAEILPRITNCLA